MKLYGLIGHPLSHSFSAKYFDSKFKQERILDCNYQLFDIKNITCFPKFIADNANLLGLNVTIPFKESVIPYLSYMDPISSKIGVVNTIFINQKDRRLTGYNTDYYGFKDLITSIPLNEHKTAIILGTGGTAKTASYVLSKLGIEVQFASRKPKHSKETSYTNLDIGSTKLIINTTPLGMYPNVQQLPPLNYDQLNSEYVLVDVIYNPAETLFLKEGKTKGCQTISGIKMLTTQAEKSWEIWNS